MKTFEELNVGTYFIWSYTAEAARKLGWIGRKRSRGSYSIAAFDKQPGTIGRSFLVSKGEMISEVIRVDNT
tara:strand:- start:165 stop:377 length:213 start_codon:yes stop_codon:yes gene_type:complete